MDRRQFFKSGLAAGTVATAGLAMPAMAKGSAPARLFEVRTRVDVTAPGRATNVYVPAFDDRAGQQVRSRSFSTGLPAAMVSDTASGSSMLHLAADSTAPVSLEMVEQVATWDHAAGAAPSLPADERARYTHILETGANRDAVMQKAAEITGGLTDPKAKLRAIHDWVIANTYRNADTVDCGFGAVGEMLREGRLGGKCADLNGMAVCLARAAGIPARENFGIRLAKSAMFPSLGANSADITGAQHCRAEGWIEGIGWFAYDPADVRKAVLQENLPVDHPQIVALADRLFGHAESNWAAYNSASEVDLPGAAHAGRYRFLLYPTAIDADGLLDRDRISYHIEVNEIVA